MCRARYIIRPKAPREAVGVPEEEHGKLWKLVENAIADLAMETAARQITTTSLTPIFAFPASASGASVAEAESAEY